MNLLQQVCKILDFGEQDLSIAINEAVNKEKLQTTWMRVNGKVQYVHKFLFDTNAIQLKNNVPIPVETLEVFLPETGMYELEGQCCFVQKQPIKQWQKSFNFKTYVCASLTTGTSIIEDYPYFLGKAKKVRFFLRKDGVLLLNRGPVGTLVDGVCIVTNPLFFQEVLDWVNKENLPWTVQ